MCVGTSSLASIDLFLVSIFSNAQINFFTACSKQSMVPNCRDPYTQEVYAGLLGGIYGCRGEMGGSKTTSVGAIISGIKRGLGGEWKVDL